MKQLISVMAVAILISCSNTENTTPTTAKDTAITKLTDTANADTGLVKMQIVKKEFKRIIAILTSKDKNQVKQLFSFPYHTDSFYLYIADMKEHSIITEKDFLKNFNKTYKEWMVEEFKELLINIPIDSLTEKALEYTESCKKTIPNCRSYYLSFEENRLCLIYDKEQNSLYEKYTENDGDDQMSVKWVFKFDGKKLVFYEQGVSMSGPGC